MGAAAGASGGAIAAHAARVNAIKATGVVVRLEIADWLKLLERTDRPLVVIGRGGVFKKHNQYLTSYRGLAFFAKSQDTIVLPRDCEIVQAKHISVPEL